MENQPPELVEDLIQPCSLDLCLGNDFIVYEHPYARDRREATERLSIPLGTDVRLSGAKVPAAVVRAGFETVPTSNTRQITLADGQALILPPGAFCLGTTREYVKLPDHIMAKVEGRSSFGRLGMTAHVTAGIIDPGFEGEITLEIANLGNLTVILTPGERVCQLVFEILDQPCERPYGHPLRKSKYLKQRGATPARVLSSTKDGQ